MQKETKSELTIIFESLLSIDGRGRPYRARELAKLLREKNLEEILIELDKIGERKWF